VERKIQRTLNKISNFKYESPTSHLKYQPTSDLSLIFGI